MKIRPKTFDPNNESDTSSEYSPLALTHVMNHYFGQKFTTWVKINCLNMILNLGSGIFPNLALCTNDLFCWKRNTDDIQAFKMADKIARKEGHWQVFVEYVNEIVDNSRDTSFLSDEDFTEIASAPIQCPDNKRSLLTN